MNGRMRLAHARFGLHHSEEPRQTLKAGQGNNTQEIGKSPLMSMAPFATAVGLGVGRSVGVSVGAPVRGSVHIGNPCVLCFVTFDVSHWPTGWLKEPAFLNMPLMRVTRDVSHWPTGWLKEPTDLNMPFICVTRDVSHWPTGWLKKPAKWNMDHMSVTRDVSHWPTGWL